MEKRREQRAEAKRVKEVRFRTKILDKLNRENFSSPVKKKKIITTFIIVDE